MNNTFESDLSALQANMVAVGLNYCENKCDIIYIHIICENDSLFTNIFFNIGGVIHTKAEISDDEKNVPIMKQKKALSELTDIAKEIMKLFEQNSRQMPAELKMIYNARTGGFNAQYGYEVITNENFTATKASKKWMEELVSK